VRTSDLDYTSYWQYTGIKEGVLKFVFLSRKDSRLRYKAATARRRTQFGTLPKYLDNNNLNISQDKRRSLFEQYFQTKMPNGTIIIHHLTSVIWCVILFIM
jgi:hypothetical protein